MKCFALSSTVVLVFLASICSDAQNVTIPVETIDGTTQIAVQATVEFKGPESRSVGTDRNGRATVSLSPGSYRETVTAPGYKTVTLNFVVLPKATDNRRGGRYLTPLNNPKR